jgi:hypothetical protein
MSVKTATVAGALTLKRGAVRVELPEWVVAAGVTQPLAEGDAHESMEDLRSGRRRV